MQMFTYQKYIHWFSATTKQFHKMRDTVLLHIIITKFKHFKKLRRILLPFNEFNFHINIQVLRYDSSLSQQPNTSNFQIIFCCFVCFKVHNMFLYINSMLTNSAISKIKIRTHYIIYNILQKFTNNYFDVVVHYYPYVTLFVVIIFQGPGW